MTRVRLIGAVSVAVAALIGLSGCGGHATAATTSRLSGMFSVTPGACASPSAKPSGSYLVVVSAAAGKAVRNRQSGCSNRDYTPLRPGTDGGVETGAFQDGPSPLFDARRNSRAGAIIAPTEFDGFRLGFATSEYDEQDSPAGQPAFVPPVAVVTGSHLTVDLRSLVLSYAGRPSSTCRQAFGLGCWQLGSRSATGSYDPTTHRYSITWFAGESFTPKGDSIEVHLEGSFAAKPAT
jgi:hypothetical protein